MENKSPENSAQDCYDVLVRALGYKSREKLERDIQLCLLLALCHIFRVRDVAALFEVIRDPETGYWDLNRPAYEIRKQAYARSQPEDPGQTPDSANRQPLVRSLGYNPDPLAALEAAERQIEASRRLARILRAATPRQRAFLELIEKHLAEGKSPREARLAAARDAGLSPAAARALLHRLRRTA
ncbi:MAG: hypothetical protein KatS3mg081_0597 [Gemmatimonadales bacterium]|nr:MAG: hypothetical protein KatS3mg081_0597 [Gemmatimonadales bacterium]